ncbi:hypothetical protein ACFYWS_20745 [Streptomyces sp. NPDC002795]|uniref:hypothetical protein n=1 Tax=Streptomyces sp. NPDC002795 TaxID=3364665 RepID=UPI0036A17850
MQLTNSALYQCARGVAELLRAPWHTDDTLSAVGIIELVGPHKRTIGMTMIRNGRTVQTWATGGTTPTPTPDAEIQPLPKGHRWHHAVNIDSLDSDQDPTAALYYAIHGNLVPAFDAKPLFVGHRPWEPDPADDADPLDVEATVRAAIDEGVDLDDEPEPEPEPEPEAQPEPEPEPEPEAQPEPEVQPEPESEPEPEPEPEVEPEPTTEPEPQPDVEPATEPEPQPKAKARPAAKRTARKPRAAASADKGASKSRPARKRATT